MAGAPRKLLLPIAAALLIALAWSATPARAQHTSIVETVLPGADLRRQPEIAAFWYTQQYIVATSAFNWRTRIADFTFINCK